MFKNTDLSFFPSVTGIAVSHACLVCGPPNATLSLGHTSQYTDLTLWHPRVGVPRTRLRVLGGHPWVSLVLPSDGMEADQPEDHRANSSALEFRQMTRTSHVGVGIVRVGFVPQVVRVLLCGEP